MAVTEAETIKKANPAPVIVIIVLLVIIILVTQFSFVAIQPIGAIPDGVTLFVLKSGLKLRFFDSPDAMCLRTMDGVSLLCRGAMMTVIADSKIIARLPFIGAIYSISTGGKEFDR